jgi:hypothetical protein
MFTFLETVPPGPVQVNEYVVFDGGTTEVKPDKSAEPDQPGPLAEQESAPVDTQAKVVDSYCEIIIGVAIRNSSTG